MLKPYSICLTLLVLAAGCDSTPRHADPEGRIAGQIKHGITRLPVDGATLKLFFGGNDHTSTTTDAEGRFIFDGVPAGSALKLQATKEGYPLHQYTVSADDFAGEEPQDNSISLVEQRMYPLGYDLVVEVVNDEGVSMPGQEVFAYGVTADQIELPDVLRATSDKDGKAVIEGIALGRSYELQIFEATKSGTVLHATATFNGSRGFQVKPEITLQVNEIDINE